MQTVHIVISLNFINQNAWPYNDDYDGWWGHKTLPKLNYEESRQLYDCILHIMEENGFPHHIMQMDGALMWQPI